MPSPLLKLPAPIARRRVLTENARFSDFFFVSLAEILVIGQHQIPFELGFDNSASNVTHQLGG